MKTFIIILIVVVMVASVVGMCVALYKIHANTEIEVRV